MYREFIRGHVPPHERNDGYVPGRVLDIRARGMIIYMDDSCHVETVVLLARQKLDLPSGKIHINAE